MACAVLGRQRGARGPVPLSFHPAEAHAADLHASAGQSLAQRREGNAPAQHRIRWATRGHPHGHEEPRNVHIYLTRHLTRNRKAPPAHEARPGRSARVQSVTPPRRRVPRARGPRGELCQPASRAQRPLVLARREAARGPPPASLGAVPPSVDAPRLHAPPVVPHAPRAQQCPLSPPAPLRAQPGSHTAPSRLAQGRSCHPASHSPHWQPPGRCQAPPPAAARPSHEAARPSHEAARPSHEAARPSSRHGPRLERPRHCRDPRLRVQRMLLPRHWCVCTTSFNARHCCACRMFWRITAAPAGCSGACAARASREALRAWRRRPRWWWSRRRGRWAWPGAGSNNQTVPYCRLPRNNINCLRVRGAPVLRP